MFEPNGYYDSDGVKSPESLDGQTVVTVQAEISHSPLLLPYIDKVSQGS